MVYFRKRLLKTFVNDCNERIVSHGLNMIRATEKEDQYLSDSLDGECNGSDTDQTISLKTTPDSQGLLLIDALCAP